MSEEAARAVLCYLSVVCRHDCHVDLLGRDRRDCESANAVCCHTNAPVSTVMGRDATSSRQDKTGNTRIIRCLNGGWLCHRHPPHSSITNSVKLYCIGNRQSRGECVNVLAPNHRLNKPATLAVDNPFGGELASKQ